MPQLFIILFAFFVQFTDKVGSERIALSNLALEKRSQRGILLDELDYAVSPIYLDSLQSLGVHIYHTSRWMNGVTIEAEIDKIEQIKQWNFVDTIYLTRTSDVNYTDKSSVSLRKKIVNEELDKRQENINIKVKGQLEQLNLHLLHELGFHGEGITMAIVDGGFQNVNSHVAFDSVRNQILGTFDMTDDIEDIYSFTGDHGTKCFGTIAAHTSEYKGAATAANYYLIRSEEYFTESPKEIDNWVAAIELADSLGVDILSSSLGYAIFDNEQFSLSYADMDGKSTRCTQAAQIATRKGMLVIIAAGNEGNKHWHYISAPADADSILSVGAVDIYDSIASFSSWGPTSDGRVKPEVCAVGYQTKLINPTNNDIIHGNGTSFACPIIAGMAACLWSALPHASNIEIRERIIRSADRYDNPHDQYGYGIPDAWNAYTQETYLLDIIQKEQVNKKILIDGILWIIHNGQLYDIMGQKKG